MQNITIDEGYKEFSINNDESRIIRFNPGDLGILTRLDSTLSVFEELEEKLTNSDKEDIVKNVKNAEKMIKEQINHVFGSDVSEIVFNGQSPVAIVKGEFLFMRVINAIIPIVEKEIEKEKKASEKRMAKYTESYRK